MQVFVLSPWRQNLGAVGNELGGMNMGIFSAALLKKQTNKKKSTLQPTTIQRLSAPTDDAYGTQGTRAKICQYSGSALLSAPALLVCVPFSGIHHSKAETQQTHFLLLRCIAFQSQG